MTPSSKPTEQDLPELVAAAVERARAARQTLTELSADEAAQVGGARYTMGPLLQQPVLAIKPGDWAGPLLAPIGQQFQNPVINAGGLRSF